MLYPGMEPDHGSMGIRMFYPGWNQNMGVWDLECSILGCNQNMGVWESEWYGKEVLAANSSSVQFRVYLNSSYSHELW